MEKGFSNHHSSEISIRDLSGSPDVLQEQLKQTFIELSNLMEEYAPAWYPEDLHKRVKSVLRSLER